MRKNVAFDLCVIIRFIVSDVFFAYLIETIQATGMRVSTENYEGTTIVSQYRERSVSNAIVLLMKLHPCKLDAQKTY